MFNSEKIKELEKRVSKLENYAYIDISKHWFCDWTPVNFIVRAILKHLNLEVKKEPAKGETILLVKKSSK